MKHSYQIRSDLFCFEPDETKEKLIYKARVLGHSGFDSNGKVRIPLYLVHFLGWNKKWDRVVPETLLLPNTKFYYKLKDIIDEIAKIEKRNQLRHDLIDEVLEIASRTDDDGNFDYEHIEPALERIRSKYKSMLSEKPKSADLSSVNEDGNKSMADKFDKPVVDAYDSIAQFEKLVSRRNDPIHLEFTPILHLSGVQMDLLQQPLVGSPEAPCVVDILQSYLDSFSDRHQSSHAPRVPRQPTTTSSVSIDTELEREYTRADVSKRLCFEVCSGLRTMFDFYVRSALLLESEWPDHDRIFGARGSSDLHTAINNDEANEFVLLPQKQRIATVVLPSLYYGVGHLLRLLVELPHLLSHSSSLTRCHLAIINRHCWALLLHLDSVAPARLSTSPPTKSRRLRPPTRSASVRSFHQ